MKTPGEKSHLCGSGGGGRGMQPGTDPVKKCGRVGVKSIENPQRLYLSKNGNFCG